ncbi:formylmethanofuran dehydrogenase subunit FmdE [Desulfotignum phosphitoxidans DSM 13687]|uniref:Formylmethanofuran dehydrogenase subunit FmdE n=2 Tax=Desulfotignum phosphitoxidans TaxID=190898 RepID=S0FSY6_9BACT|nr:formylmethanofuran dehydrogenase subunit FmdE [Desulfotignum phosphitoxidans DSM 13687]
MTDRKDFETLVQESAQIHGHLCPGQVIGVRMALLGCRLIGLDDPQSRSQIKKLIVYLEMDRCAGDAIAHVTGVKLGRRSLKFMNYGIMAATFLNIETHKAFRIISTEEARDLAVVYAPEIFEKSAQQLAAYKRMPDDVLFRVQRVNITLNDFDMPGPTRRKIVCSRCGQLVRDHREIMIDGKPVCRPCSEDVYFSDPSEVSLGGLNVAREKDYYRPNPCVLENSI